MLVQEAVTVLRAVDNSLSNILSRMQELAKSLPEYSTVRAMGGVGDVLGITKRGSSTLRKVGYEVMRVLKSHKAPKDDTVYNYMIRSPKVVE